MAFPPPSQSYRMLEFSFISTLAPAFRSRDRLTASQPKKSEALASPLQGSGPPSRHNSGQK